MAKKSKQSTNAAKKREKKLSVRRQERRFVSQSTTSPTIVRGLGALSAILLGAGLWAFFYAKSFEDEKLKAIPSYLIAGGAVLMGITIWIGTSSEPPLRVGAPGIAMEKGELRRMPWWAISKISFDSGTLGLFIKGKDESGVDWSFKVPLKSHAEAIGWILKEALDRIPKRVDIAEETLGQMPAAGEHAGLKVDLEPLQVVGKRCAVTGKTISYEPDARVCPRCERVYSKTAVPKKCKCGNSLMNLRSKDAIDEEEEEENADEDNDTRSSSRLATASESESESEIETETETEKEKETAE